MKKLVEKKREKKGKTNLGTFGEHSGNTEETFGEHFGNIQGTSRSFREHRGRSGNIEVI
jgi:hypothetical protein